MKCLICQAEKTCPHKTWGLVGIILVIILGGYFLLRGGSQGPKEALPTPVSPENKEELISPPEEKTVGEVREITVSGSEFSFTPSSIILKEGERVRLTFENTGQAPHDLTIEDLGIATKVIAAGQTDTIEFTAPTSGTYPIFCSVAGHRQRGMEGSLEVE